MRLGSRAEVWTCSPKTRRAARCDIRDRRAETSRIKGWTSQSTSAVASGSPGAGAGSVSAAGDDTIRIITILINIREGP
jgi:hypothetical protein